MLKGHTLRAGRDGVIPHPANGLRSRRKRSLLSFQRPAPPAEKKAPDSRQRPERIRIVVSIGSLGLSSVELRDFLTRLFEAAGEWYQRRAHCQAAPAPAAHSPDGLSGRPGAW